MVVYLVETMAQHIDACLLFTDDVVENSYASVAIVQSLALPANKSVLVNIFTLTKSEPYPAALPNFPRHQTGASQRRTGPQLRFPDQG